MTDARAARVARMEMANALVRAIGSRGIGFFHAGGVFGRFEMDGGRLWWRDERTGMRVWPHRTWGNRHRGFSHGGTLWALVNELRRFVATGEPTAMRLFADPDHWGYAEAEFGALRRIGRGIGFLHRPEEIAAMRAAHLAGGGERPSGSVFRLGGTAGAVTVLMEWAGDDGQARRAVVAGPYGERGAAAREMDRLAALPESRPAAPSRTI